MIKINDFIETKSRMDETQFMETADQVNGGVTTVWGGSRVSALNCF